MLCYVTRQLTASGLSMQLGATVASATSDAVTHVVSGSDQTDKVHWARKQGRHVVSTGWLNAAGNAYIPSSSRLLWCACHIFPAD